ncbi:MAG: histidine phosphatase family protein [bacterium]
MLSLLASLAFVVHLATPAPDSAQVRREELMAKLRSGGYSVLLRHARTDYSVQEPMGTTPVERSAQRNLSDDGIRDAALMGVVFRKYGISFAEILSSPMFRAVETAEMAAGKPTTTTMALRVFPSTPEQEQIVKTAPKPGTNRLIVTHHFVIEKFVPGITPGAVAESEAAVVSYAPDGTLRLVGIIKLDDWKLLANPGSGATAAAAPAGALVHAAPATAAAHGAPASIPNSNAGHLAHGYILAFNSGDASAMRTFIQSSLVVNPQRPLEERVTSYLKLFEDHGPLALVSLDSATATQVTLGVRSKQGALMLTVKTSDTDPERAASVTLATLGNHP